MSGRREVLDWLLIVVEISVVAFMGWAIRRLMTMLFPQINSWVLLLVVAVLITTMVVADRKLRAWLKTQAWWRESLPPEHHE